LKGGQCGSSQKKERRRQNHNSKKRRPFRKLGRDKIQRYEIAGASKRELKGSYEHGQTRLQAKRSWHLSETTKQLKGLNDRSSGIGVVNIRKKARTFYWGREGHLG